MTERKAAEDPLVKLARLALETYVRTGERLGEKDVPAALRAKLEAAAPKGAAGCFVSLKKDGELRGCIGTILPTKPTLRQEVLSNAVAAGAHDPRFSPVSEDELPELVYDVDVLSKPEPIRGPGQLDTKRYGVIVSTRDGRRGLLLPDLDGVDTIEQQVRIAARKGGIDLDRDDWQLERFEVVRHT
jgi:AmmeMemoRadiSam system protein A